METPSSIRKTEESEKGFLKSRSVLIDITNDSPIVGLATGNLRTPSSTFSKKRMIIQKQATTPGSGEALLRGQVKTLLQKVEEEAVISKISFQPINFMNSQMYFLAPTPANTPQLSYNDSDGPISLTISPVVAENFNFSQIIDQQEEDEEALESNLITKMLFTDFTEESEGYNPSLDNEDDESIWSIQVNASTCDEHEIGEEFEVNYEDGVVDELCEEMSNIYANDGVKFCEEHNGEIEEDA